MSSATMDVRDFRVEPEPFTEFYDMDRVRVTERGVRQMCAALVLGEDAREKTEADCLMCRRSTHSEDCLVGQSAALARIHMMLTGGMDLGQPLDENRAT